MNGKQLKNSILQWAIQGKLVPQDPNDEPASVLLERIRAEKARLVKEGKIKKDKNESIIFRGDDNSYYEKFPDGTVKCIDDEIPFEIPEGWEWCKINNIAFVTKLAGFEYTKYIADNLQTTGVPLFKGKNVQGGKVIYDFEAFIPESLSDELERSQISKKCLLTPYVGTIGNIGIHNRSGKFHLGSNVGKIEILNPTSEVCILEEYVHIYLLSQYGYAELTKYKKATAQESISIEAIREVLVPLPPIQEQKKIVDKYFELEPLLDKYYKSQGILNRLNAEIFEKLNKSVLQEAIQGKLVSQDPNDEPASVLLERIREEKQRLLKEGKLKKKDITDSIIFKGDDNKYYERIGTEIAEIELPFSFPESWAIVKLHSISALIDGEKRTGNYICLDAKYLRGKSYGEQMKAGRFVHSGDNIILVDGENSGEVFTTPIDGYMGSTFKQLWVSETLYLPYVLACIRFYKEELRNSKKGAAIPHLNKDIFRNLIVGIPPISEQFRIMQKIELIQALLYT